MESHCWSLTIVLMMFCTNSICAPFSNMADEIHTEQLCFPISTNITCNRNLVIHTTDGRLISSDQLVNNARQSHISVVKFNTRLILEKMLTSRSPGEVDLSTFVWVNDRVGAKIVSYPVNYEYLSLGTLIFEETNVDITFTNATIRDCFNDYKEVMLAMQTLIRNVSEHDRICFRHLNLTLFNNHLLNLAYSYFYYAMQGSHYSCFTLLDRPKICKVKINNFIWNEVITAISLFVMLFSPLLIGVFLMNPHRKPSDIITSRPAYVSNEAILRQEVEEHVPRLALNSPLPLGTRYTLFHWGNANRIIRSIRIFIFLTLVISALILLEIFGDDKSTKNYLNVYYHENVSLHYVITYRLMLRVLQILSLFIVVFFPQSLSVFNDESDCGLDFENNQYTCMYRQALNRLTLVTSCRLWNERQFSSTSRNRSIICRLLLLIIDVIITFGRWLSCAFPAVFLISAPATSFIKSILNFYTNSAERKLYKECILLLVKLFLAILFTIFVGTLCLQLVIIVIIMMQIIVLTTIGIVTNYGENEVIVLQVITALLFGMYVIDGFQKYYDCYANVWRTIVDAGESWQAGHDGEDFNEVNRDPNLQRNTLLRMRTDIPLQNPLVIYTELIPNLPEDLLFHVVNNCKKRSVQVAKIVSWNVVVGLFFAVALYTIISTHEYNEFTQVTKSMLTLALGAFPKLISIAFTTQEYATRQEAKQRRICHEASVD
ncbi:uncharacterized protein LOC117111853 isoform X2 [Anneissia japonica]|uniref:uncharacterized protein LOC117111853 isoform X2 n=1 Tax=Anneissia japonica TaxID=1529436 RepID=UPI001425ABFB|nr:uncharacterized protein LOC117111853 isoform X2 [Anneissia japonica]